MGMELAYKPKKCVESSCAKDINANLGGTTGCAHWPTNPTNHSDDAGPQYFQPPSDEHILTMSIQLVSPCVALTHTHTYIYISLSLCVCVCVLQRFTELSEMGARMCAGSKVVCSRSSLVTPDNKPALEGGVHPCFANLRLVAVGAQPVKPSRFLGPPQPIGPPPWLLPGQICCSASTATVCCQHSLHSWPIAGDTWTGPLPDWITGIYLLWSELSGWIVDRSCNLHLLPTKLGSLMVVFSKSVSRSFQTGMWKNVSNSFCNGEAVCCTSSWKCCWICMIWLHLKLQVCGNDK